MVSRCLQSSHSSAAYCTLPEGRFNLVPSSPFPLRARPTAHNPPLYHSFARVFSLQLSLVHLHSYTTPHTRWLPSGSPCPLHASVSWSTWHTSWAREPSLPSSTTSSAATLKARTLLPPAVSEAYISVASSRSFVTHMTATLLADAEPLVLLQGEVQHPQTSLQHGRILQHGLQPPQMNGANKDMLELANHGMLAAFEESKSGSEAAAKVCHHHTLVCLQRLHTTNFLLCVIPRPGMCRMAFRPRLPLLWSRPHDLMSESPPLHSALMSMSCLPLDATQLSWIGTLESRHWQLPFLQRQALRRLRRPPRHVRRKTSRMSLRAR